MSGSIRSDEERADGPSGPPALSLNGEKKLLLSIPQQ